MIYRGKLLAVHFTDGMKFKTQLYLKKYISLICATTNSEQLTFIIYLQIYTKY